MLVYVASKRSKEMFWVCVCVFFWDFGYAWMSMCYYDDIAYSARAVSLFAVSIYMVFAVKYIIEVTGFHKRESNIAISIIFILSLASMFLFKASIKFCDFAL